MKTQTHTPVPWRIILSEFHQHTAEFRPAGGHTPAIPTPAGTISHGGR